MREDFAADFVDSGLWEEPRVGLRRRPLLGVREATTEFRSLEALKR